MKHNRVLNRPMFNPNVSAYGRGITTNLVTEQERQKFNYGGRVHANIGKYMLWDLPKAGVKWGLKKFKPPTWATKPIKSFAAPPQRRRGPPGRRPASLERVPHDVSARVHVPGPDPLAARCGSRPAAGRDRKHSRANVMKD